MKIRTLTAVALLALFASTSASAGKLVLKSTNHSDGAIAVGGDTSAYDTPFGEFDSMGGRAIAGSVTLDVKGCGCRRQVTIRNDGAGSIAVGKATAGSTTLTMY